MSRVKLLRPIAAALGGALVLSSPAAAQTAQPLIGLSVGAFDAFYSDDPAPEFGVQLRRERWLWRLGPTAGVMFTTQGAVNAYAGVSLDAPLGRRFVLRASFAPGAYARNDGKNLHDVVEFRSGFEAAVRFASGLRVGAEFYHLSNGGLGEGNPGENSLVLTVALPLSRSGRGHDSTSSGP